MPDAQQLRSSKATLEKVLLRRCSFRTKQDARTAIFDWIETWYKRERRHSSLGYRSPAKNERERSDYAREDDRKNFIEERARAA